MRAVIVSGGNITNYDYIKKQINEKDTIICADSGYNHIVNMNLKADLLVGDFDSIGKLPLNIKTIKYPTEKDKTDTELAIDYAREMGFKEFLIIACTGTRMDHTLTNIFLLTNFLNNNEYAEIIDEHNKIMITNNILHLNEEKGSIVSIIPLCNCLDITTKNLKYPLYKASMQVGKGLGVSNIMVDNFASIYIGKGTILVIVAKD